MIIIRAEDIQHIAGIRRVEERAFGSAAEADLVDRLRQRGAVLLSLVALDEGEVVGHILFTAVRIVNGAESYPIAGLGPVAVLPERQGQGIGARLINAGLEELRQQGCPAVVLLGHPDYYPRFGFAPARRWSIRFQDESVPEDAFMALELRRGALEDHPGIACYEPEFSEV